MYCMGVSYEPVGTAPQDGEHKVVLKVLQEAAKIVESQIQKYD